MIGWLRLMLHLFGIGFISFMLLELEVAMILVAKPEAVVEIDILKLTP